MTHSLPPFPLDLPLPIPDYIHVVACAGGPKIVLQNSLISAMITGGLMSHAYGVIRRHSAKVGEMQDT